MTQDILINDFVSSFSIMVEAELQLDSLREIAVTNSDKIIRCCLFNIMKDGDGLITIHISKEKVIDLKVIGPGKVQLKLIKENISNCGKVNYNKQRDMILYLVRRLVQIALFYHQLNVTELKTTSEEEINISLNDKMRNFSTTDLMETNPLIYCKDSSKSIFKSFSITKHGDISLSSKKLKRKPPQKNDDGLLYSVLSKLSKVTYSYISLLD